jgi:uncharacterized RDD family membrane protein YckC
MGAHWRRSGVDSDTPLASLPPTGLSEPPPTRQPLWKQELNRKLEGYRDRQKQGEEEREMVSAKAVESHRPENHRPESQRPENRGGLPPGRMAAAAGAGTASKRLPPLPAQPVGPAGPKPQAERHWRRVVPTGDSPKLPPLPKPAVPAGFAGLAKSAAGTETGARTDSAPRTKAAAPEAIPAAPRPRHDREVAAAAPIAPLAIRAVAGVLDFSVIVVAVGMFLAVFYLMGGVALTDVEGLRSIAIAFLVIVCFYWVFYVGYLGGTSGMNWLGLRVLNFDGDPPTKAQRRARAVGTILSTLSLGLGFAWSIADEEKLTWHDRMSKTFVTRDGSIGFRTRPAGSAGAGKRLPELRSATRA